MTGSSASPGENPEAALQAEVAHEQSNLDLLYALLDAQRERTERELDRTRRMPGSNTPGGTAERDAFDAWRSERLAQFLAVEDRLCFGRLDLIDGTRRYVGRIGLSDEDQKQLLIDWRAPAAAAFYQATAAAPDGVVRRRQIGTKVRRVTSLDDEVLGGADAEDLGVVAGEGALMSALTAHRTGHMRDIVATLQAEQDRIVRAPLPGVLVVQGGPGTGKTAVALHRAAYLLYTHRQRIARSGVLVVGPSPVFVRYIEQVLPSLGETGVVLSTIGQLYPGVDTSRLDPPRTAVVKGDLVMAKVIKAAVRARQRSLESSIKIPLDDGTIVYLRPRTVAIARARARSTGKPHNDARVTFVQHLLDDLANQVAEQRHFDLDDEHTRAEVVADLRDNVGVRREINLRWMPLTPEKLVRDLLTKPARLAEAAAGLMGPSKQLALLRGADELWTVADVPLLDEAAELIGADVAISGPAAAVARAARQEAIDYAQGVLDAAGDVASMMTAEALVDRFADGGPTRTLAERAGADRSWTYGHAVVDEAQELSAMQWRMLIRRVPSRSMTVVGDVAQTGSAAGTTSWADALDQHAEGRWTLEELTVNYRTPAKIVELATSVLTAAGQKPGHSTTAREGDWEPVIRRFSEDASGGSSPGSRAEDVAAALREDDALLGGGQFAVIAPRALVEGLRAELRPRLAAGSPPDAVRGERSALAERVAFHTVDDVKGLEFDGVVVVLPQTIAEESPRGANDLYVALTRPTQRATLLHDGRLPSPL